MIKAWQKANFKLKVSGGSLIANRGTLLADTLNADTATIYEPGITGPATMILDIQGSFIDGDVVSVVLTGEVFRESLIIHNGQPLGHLEILSLRNRQIFAVDSQNTVELFDNIVDPELSGTLEQKISQERELRVLKDQDLQSQIQSNNQDISALQNVTILQGQ